VLEAVRILPEPEVPTSVEFCHANTGVLFSAGFQRGSELWSPVERVCALTGFDLGVLANNLQPLGLCEVGDGRLLRFKTEAGSSLFLSGHTIVGNKALMHGRSCNIKTHA
jgi:hypothetical protein